jgi:uncharacterized spore protein YtfJ
MDPQEIVASVRDALSARRVFGDPIDTPEGTVIPVALIAGGGGGGGGQAPMAGAGFGLTARGAGVFVVRNGDAKWRPVVDVNRIILGGQLVAITALIALRPVLVRWLAPRRLA